jgi:diacylglycerol kinase (ATP)
VKEIKEVYRQERQPTPLTKAEMQELRQREYHKREIPKNTLFRSFGFAFQGIFYVIRTQRNMQIHLAAGAMVLAFALFFQVSLVEWSILLVTMALVYSLEMVNTVAEALVDMITQEYHPLAKVAKDVAAGAVLVAAIFAVGVALAIFAPRILHLLFNL